MSDNMHIIWDKFFSQRGKVLWERFPGHYRAIVVETNDPLNINRVRFKCPDMHDFDLLPEYCPWAVPSPEFGGLRTGRFVHACIGDWVWISFERQHPYAPIWVGFANPTRRKFYTYPQVFSITPLSVDAEGRVDGRPEDYDIDYLPSDGRPMAHGWQDRYGNLDMHSSVGYYPVEHAKSGSVQGNDAIAQESFGDPLGAPRSNQPDKKYMVRCTKYGNMLLMGDQGYWWKKGEIEDTGEFVGDFAEDEQYEIKRWKYLQRLINEDKPDSTRPNGDQRRILTMTRYGHRIECRDVGWGQKGPMESKSRSGEYGPPAFVSVEEKNDFRWIKIRTKGGMLFQAYDKGSDPGKDVLIKRKLVEEQGHLSEREDKYWAKKDARWMRLVTRHGLKIVLDDRGTDPIDSLKKESPRPNGILIKGRRTPMVKGKEKRGNPRGFYWEFNENDLANHTSWGTPMGLAMEMNDRYQYMMLSASMGDGWASKWRGIKENEFIRKPTMLRHPERNSHHLKLDHDNEYLRLKTRANRGTKPKLGVNRSGVGPNALHQGLEARDGSQGDGPWVELVDCQHRGMWFSKYLKLGIWRAQKKRKMYMYMDEPKREIVVYNKDGKTIIYANKDIHIVSDRNICFEAKQNITMKAGNAIKMQAGGTKMTVGAAVSTNVRVNAASFRGRYDGLRVKISVAGKPAHSHKATVESSPNPGGAAVNAIKAPQLPSQLEPRDRAKTYNEPFEECPRDEVEHPIK